MYDENDRRFDDVVYPLKTPFFMRTMKEISQEHGPMRAISESFERANITVEVNNGENIITTDNALLLYGDHRNVAEKWPLIAWLGNISHRECFFLSKPYSLQARLLQSLGGQATRLTLPVLPRNLASQKENRYNTRLVGKVRKRSGLTDDNSIKQLNQASLAKAAQALASRQALVVFPTGNSQDALCAPWQAGLGKIIGSLPSKSREQTLLVPFRFDTFSKTTILRNFWLREIGLQPPSYSIPLYIGKTIMSNEIPNENIIEELRLNYCADFDR